MQRSFRRSSEAPFPALDFRFARASVFHAYEEGQEVSPAFILSSALQPGGPGATETIMRQVDCRPEGGMGQPHRASERHRSVPGALQDETHVFPRPDLRAPGTQLAPVGARRTFLGIPGGERVLRMQLSQASGTRPGQQGGIGARKQEPLPVGRKIDFGPDEVGNGQSQLRPSVSLQGGSRPVDAQVYPECEGFHRTEGVEGVDGKGHA